MSTPRSVVGATHVLPGVRCDGVSGLRGRTHAPRNIVVYLNGRGTSNPWATHVLPLRVQAVALIPQGRCDDPVAATHALPGFCCDALSGSLARVHTCTVKGHRMLQRLRHIQPVGDTCFAPMRSGCRLDSARAMRRSRSGNACVARVLLRRRIRIAVTYARPHPKKSSYFRIAAAHSTRGQHMCCPYADGRRRRDVAATHVLPGFR